MGNGSARETSASDVRVHDEIRPSLSVVLFPRGKKVPSADRTKREVDTLAAGRPWVVSSI